MRISDANKNGFTLIEILVVITIMSLLVMVSIPVYRDYSDRARSSEIVMRYDAMESAVVGNPSSAQQDNCAVIAAYLDSGNLGDDFARLSVGFEAINGQPLQGYRPVLQVCARDDRQGASAVRIARAAFEELSANAHIESGAVISDFLVSFAAPLTQDNRAVCFVPVGGATTPCGDAVAVPTATAQVAPPVASTLPSQAPPLLRQGTPQCIPPANTMVDRPVMQFNGGANGYIVNDGDLDTGGDMRELTVEMAFMGDQQVSASGIHGATILSYATTTNSNEFIVWNPESVTVSFGGDNFDTNLDINDGQSHRLTVSWDSASGGMQVYDNGARVWSGTAHQGDVIGGNGKLALGGDQDNYGGGFSNEDSFRGRIVGASLATTVVPGSNIQRGPINTAVDTSSGLVTSIAANAQGGFEDTTGQYQYSSGSAMSSTRAQVPSSLYVSNDCT